MVAGRSHEREAAAIDRLQRDARREDGRVPGRLRRNRVGVEQQRPFDRAQEGEMAVGVHARELLVRRLPLDGRAAEPEQPRLALRMVVSRRVQVSQRGIRQELDSASKRPASRPRPHSPASAAARPHVGSWSSSGGKGASASIVAMWR